MTRLEEPKGETMESQECKPDKAVPEAIAAPTTRTQEDIVNRYEARSGSDTLGFEVGEYIDYLDFSHATPYLETGTTAEQWGKITVSAPKQAMVNYMEFAFGKAHGKRGISANRSIKHMIAWAWLSGDDELLASIEDGYASSYCHYGLPILRGICERLGIDPKEYGDY